MLTIAGALAAIALCAPAPQPLRATIATNGGIVLEMGRKPLATLEPGLFEAEWRGASLAGAPGGPGGVLRGAINAPGGARVATELRATPAAGGLALEYRLTPDRAVRLNSLHVALQLPASVAAGGRFIVDETERPIPAILGAVGLHSGPVRSLRIIPPAAAALRFTFAAATPVLVQDDRQWGQTFTVRIGPQLDGKSEWPAGRTLTLAFTITAQGGIAVDQDGPTTIAAGPLWIPLDTELDIEAGSALDLGAALPWHAPAGRLGRVIVSKTGAMAFAARPAEPVRFYGANLCFSAQVITHELADRVAERLHRLGYNAMRIHHYENVLIDRSGGTSVVLSPEAMEKFDYLLAALRKRGIYITTDLFVSRSVFAAEIWPGAEGDVGMDEFKMAIPANERAWENYVAFARALLLHRNPYTGLTLAEDPMLGWLSLINEGNPGNFVGLLKGNLRADYQAAWTAWLAKRRPAAPAADLPADDRSPDWPEFQSFLAENQRAFMERARAYLRDELRCQALITNMNAWTNPVQIQTVRRQMDYVDDHFYVDHPEFIERPWSLPSKCANTSPVEQGAPGGRPGAFLRVMGKPYTCSEFNYSGPGRFRGVGGILTGALGAVQDWSVIWRFAYSHNRESLAGPVAAGYFDMASDPLSQAADRASVCLFRRGDLAPARHAVAVAFTPDEALDGAARTPSAAMGWNALAWVSRVGSIVTDQPAAAAGADMILPLAWKTRAADWPGSAAIDPYAPDAGDRILAEMRSRKWLEPTNVTDLASRRYQNDNGQVTIDGAADRLTLDTPRTAGGYAVAGAAIVTKAVRITIDETDATVWVSSIDGQPISQSRRLLVTHLTDLQNTGASYADHARRILTGWGALPHLVLAGRATVIIRTAAAARATVWALSTGGRRLAKIPAKASATTLTIPLSVDAAGRARMLYEVEIR